MHRLQPAFRRNLFVEKLRGALLSSSSTRPQLFPEELNIIYDSKCGICKLEMDFLSRRDAKLSSSSGAAARKIRLTDVESESYDPNDPSNGGVSYAKGMAAIHAVTADGRVIEGVPVLGKAYELVGLGWLFQFTEWRVMKPVVRWGYEVFAKYRTTVTRGSSLDDLIEAHRAKKALQEDELEECDSCNNLRR